MTVTERLTVEATDDRLTIIVSGLLDGELAWAIHERLVGAFVAAADLDVVVDLREIAAYDDSGAEGLLRAHEVVAERSRRSVYIVERPRVRALVFKCIHGTQDERTRPVSTPEMAEAWLREPSPQAFADVSLDRARSLLARFRAKLAAREEALR